MRLETIRELDTYLKGLEKFGMVFGLDRIRELLACLENPQNAFTSVHIAGSNGKGSTAAMIQQALTESGVTCGLYTSPHLQRFSERYRCGEKEISDAELLRHANRLLERIERRQISKGFTYFDFTTAMAFDYFAEKRVDVAVIEAGLGGRLDSTNILKPILSVITPISLEHTQVLGETLGEIALEKAGIIKPQTPVVIGKQVPEALEVLLEKAAERQAPCAVYGRDFTIFSHGDAFDFHQGSVSLPHLKTSLLGEHQKENAALALSALLTLENLGIPVKKDVLAESLGHVHWPGRGEIFCLKGDPSIRIMLDGAHNPGGAEILARTLQTLPFQRLHIMIGILADKDIEAIAERLLSLADHVIAVAPRIDRAPDVRSFADRIRVFLTPTAVFDVAGSIPDGIPGAVASLNSGDLLVITGSLYTVGEARDIIERNSAWRKMVP